MKVCFVCIANLWHERRHHIMYPTRGLVAAPYDDITVCDYCYNEIDWGGAWEYAVQFWMTRKYYELKAPLTVLQQELQEVSVGI